MRIFLFCICFSTFAFLKNSFAEVNPIADSSIPSISGASSPEAMFFADMPAVITASKSAQTIESAPSAMTVWTDADIKMMGLKTIEEVLERTVGFFPGFQYASPVIGSRGFISDTNVAYLFLVDGHNINNIAQQGAGQTYLMPTLDKVKRIEIVRGPGSTLWGSDAALAVINIITLDGKDVDGFQTSIDYSSANGQKLFNALYGNKASNTLISFTLTNTYGFPYNNKYVANPNMFAGDYDSKSYYQSFYGSSGRDTGPLYAMNNSWEVYAKENLNNLVLSAYMTNEIGPDLWAVSGDRKAMYWLTNRTSFIDAKYTLDINDSATLESRVYADFQAQNSHMYNPQNDSSANNAMEQNEAKTQGGGIDELFSQKFKDVDTLKIGLHYVQTTIDPVFSYNSLATSSTTLAQLAAAGNPEAISAITIPKSNDREMAAFIENEWKVFEKLSLTGGLRVDNDSLRDKTTSYLPRFAAVYCPTERWSLKYLFNTGYVRPPILNSYLGNTPYNLPTPNAPVGYYAVGATKPQTIIDNDVQIGYKNDNMDITATLYRTELKNFFDYDGSFLTSDGSDTGKSISKDGLLYRFTTVNANAIITKGLELETRSKITENASWYANYSYIYSSKVNQLNFTVLGYAQSFSPALFDNNRDMCDYPKQVWNLGTNMQLIKNLTLNLNYRGWCQIRTMADSTLAKTLYKTLPAGGSVDTALVYDSIAGTGWGASIYIKNLFNKDNKYGLVYGGGYWIGMARSVGAKISYKF